MSILKILQKLLMKPLSLLENKYVSGALKIFLILYAATVAPKLPSFMVSLLKNQIVKLLILFLIVYTGVKDPMLSLLIAVGLRLGVLPLHIYYLHEPPLRRGLGSMLRFVPAAASLVLLARIGEVGIPLEITPYLLTQSVQNVLTTCNN